MAEFYNPGVLQLGDPAKNGNRSHAFLLPTLFEPGMIKRRLSEKSILVFIFHWLA